MQEYSRICRLVVIAGACMLVACAQNSSKADDRVKSSPFSEGGARAVAADPVPKASAPVMPNAPSVSYQDLSYQRYNAAHPVLPDDYPAKRYDVSQLRQRLVIVANSSTLSREGIEHEFGLQFVQTTSKRGYEAVARGRYPLGDAFSWYYDNSSEEKGIRSLALSMADYDTSTWDRKSNRPVKVCILVGDIYKALAQSGWERVEPNKGTHYALRIFYRRISDGRAKRVELDPPSQSGDACMRSFHVSDSTDPGPDPANK